MRLTIIILLLLILSVKAEDAYTACRCVRRRLRNKTCHYFVRYAVPKCAPDADWKACEALCCSRCRLYGDYWPVCRSALLQKLCKTRARMKSGSIGPGKNEESDVMPSEQPDVLPSGEPVESPDEMEATPVSVESEPTEEGPARVKPTPVAPKEDKPKKSDDRSTAGSVQPPFDATNEGELDLTPATDGRPFAPAACACMSRGTKCDTVLAAASGVCEAGIQGIRQSGDCKFACCRICIVNIYATYCDDETIRQACGL